MGRRIDSMAFPYKKVLMFGATSNVGQALADQIVGDGHYVIAVSRQAAKLEKFAQKHGKGKTDFAVFDVTRLDQIPTFASDMLRRHPDIDCVFLNAGILRGTNFAEPSSIDLGVIGEEFTTNYLSYIALTKAFLPHLQTASQAGKKVSLVYTTSNLALLPVPRCLNYCAAKAAMHQAVLCIRLQLSKAGYSNLNVIELMPPAIHAESHDEEERVRKNSKTSVPLDTFTDIAWAGLCKGDEQISVGNYGGNAAATWESERQRTLEGMLERAPDTWIFGE